MFASGKMDVCPREDGRFPGVSLYSKGVSCYYPRCLLLLSRANLNKEVFPPISRYERDIMR